MAVVAHSRGSRWPNEVLRAALAEFTADRTDWPTAGEFNAAGREDLRCAIKSQGGATYWAKELGKTLRPKQERSPYGEREALSDARTLSARLGHIPGSNRARELGYHRFATHLRKSGGARQFARRHGFTEPPFRP